MSDKKMPVKPTKPSAFEGIDNDRLEDVVINVAKEGQQEAEIKELEAALTKTKRTIRDQESMIKALEACVSKDTDSEAEIAKLKELLKKAKAGPQVHECGMKSINELRKQDIPKVNRTCSCCTRRVPLKMMNMRPSEFCSDCLSK